MGIIVFSNGARINEEIIEKTCDCVLSTIKKELSEEALPYEVYAYVIGKCTDKLMQKKIVL